MKHLYALIILCLTFLPFTRSIAGGFHTCEGEILNIVTRATPEDTQVSIKGMNGYARLGFGGDAFKNLHERQFSMLLAAHLAGRKVKLEFENSNLDCSYNHSGIKIRYVMIPND
jgi:hypothetical protein